MDIPRDFPGIFRLQDPRVAHADDLCRVLQVMKSDPQPIDRSVHGLENAVIDGKPSLVRFDRRRARTDLHFVPVIRFGPHDELGLAPKAQIRRIGNPDGPRGDFRMGPVQPGIEAVELLGEDHDIPIVRLGDEGDPFHLTEVLRLCQGDPHAISRVGAVGDEVLPVHACHAWILDAELFVGRKGAVAAQESERAPDRR